MNSFSRKILRSAILLKAGRFRFHDTGKQLGIHY